MTFSFDNIFPYFCDCNGDGYLITLQSAIRSNLQYAALSTLRRLPLDPGNPAFLHRAVQG